MSDELPGQRKPAEFVGDLVRIGVEELRTALGVPAEQAEASMRRVASEIVSLYARTMMYIPLAYDLRNEELYRKYGQPTATARAYSQARVLELAAEYHLTARQVYIIVGARRARELADAQPKLDFETPPD